jgi:ATP-dependent DNA helicase RecG
MTEITHLISQGETLHTEFKSARVHQDSLVSTFVSFLNTQGGVLLLGVEDDGTVSGVVDIDQTRQWVDQILSNNITPRATAYVENLIYQEQTVLKITVPRGLDRPYQTQKGQIYIRVNAGKRLASREEIRRMYLTIRAFYYDESVVLGTTIGDVNRQQFDDFLNISYGYSTDEDRTDVERVRLLGNLKAMQGDELTVAGLLFFGKSPTQHLPTARIEFAYFQGTVSGETILDRKSLTGCLSDQLADIERLLKIHLHQDGQIQNFTPEVRYEMPLTMLREAIVNALVHRDYSLSSPIRLLMFTDRLELHSPGCLPNGITVDNIRMGVHVERNPIILSLMAKLGLMTRLGTGIMRIVRLAKEAGLPEPNFVETETEFIVTLYRK